MSHFDCPFIENFIWINPHLRGHLSYKATFRCSKGDLLLQVWLYIFFAFCHSHLRLTPNVSDAVLINSNPNSNPIPRTHSLTLITRRVWRYQRGNQNRIAKNRHTTLCSNEKVQKYKQQSTKHTYRAKDRVTRTPLKAGGEFRCSGRVVSSCSICDTLRANLVTKPVINISWTVYPSCDWEKRIMKWNLNSDVINSTDHLSS